MASISLLFFRPPPASRVISRCAKLGDGKVVVAGGYRGANTPEATDLSTAEVGREGQEDARGRRKKKEGGWGRNE